MIRWTRRGAGHAWGWWWGQQEGEGEEEGEEEEEREGAAKVVGGSRVEPIAVPSAKGDASESDWEIHVPALAAGGKARPVDTGGTKEQLDPWLASGLASSCLDAMQGVLAVSGARAVFESTRQCVGGGGGGVERESMMCWNMTDMTMSIHRMPRRGWDPVAFVES